jgi:OOP family OmpA-OmpF porin
MSSPGGRRIGRSIVLLLLLAAFAWGFYARFIVPRGGIGALNLPLLPKSARPFTVVVDSWVGSLPVQLIKARGYDEELGLKIEIKYAESDADRLKMLANGQADFTSIALNSWVRNSESLRAGSQAIFKIDDSYGADALIVNGNKIKTLNDLIDKKVAFTNNGVGEYFLYYLLKIVGLSPRDVVLLPQDSMDEVVAAFKDGRADAVVSWEPEITNQLLPLAGARKLVSTREAANLIVDIGVASDRAIQQRSDDIAKFTQAWFTAVNYLASRPDSAYDRLSQALPSDVYGSLSASDIKAMFSGVKMTPFADNLTVFAVSSDGGKTVRCDQLIDSVNNVYMAAGKIKHGMSTSAFTGKYIAAAQTALGQGTLDPSLVGGGTGGSGSTTAPTKIDPSKVEQVTKAVAQLQVDRINFDPDSAVIRPESYAILDQVIQTMRNFPTYYLSIDGYVHDIYGGRGTGSQLQGLQAFSLKRAEAVGKYITEHGGLDANRVIVRGLGATKQVSATDPEQNRRTEFRLVEAVSAGR